MILILLFLAIIIIRIKLKSSSPYLHHHHHHHTQLFLAVQTEIRFDLVYQSWFLEMRMGLFLACMEKNCSFWSGIIVLFYTIFAYPLNQTGSRMYEFDAMPKHMNIFDLSVEEILTQLSNKWGKNYSNFSL